MSIKPKPRSTAELVKKWHEKCEELKTNPVRRFKVDRLLAKFLKEHSTMESVSPEELEKWK